MPKKSVNVKRGFRAFLIIFLFMLLAVSSVTADSSTEVNVSPSTQEVSPNTDFSVEIQVNPSEPIAGVQFDLSFDPSLVAVESVEEGDLLSQDGASTYFQSGDINNSAGTITGVAGAITTPGESVSSSGTFAVINFTAESDAGASSLYLSNVIVGNPDAEEVPITVSDGSVTVDDQSGEDNYIDSGGLDSDNQGENSLSELVVDSFNDGSGPNDLGGGCGTMDPSPGDSNETIEEAYIQNSYEGMGALRLDYDRGSTSWVGYWTLMRADETGRDVSEYDSLRMWVKGADGGEVFKVELSDTSFDSSRYQETSSHQSSTYITMVPGFSEGATTSWQELVIPLSNFVGVNMADLKQTCLVFDRDPSPGTVLVDMIRFTTENQIDSPVEDNDLTPEDNISEEDNQPLDNETTGNTPNEPPVAYIDLITPNPAEVGQTVAFYGRGEDSDGNIMGYLWELGGENLLSTEGSFESDDLPAGSHEITLMVQDDDGSWSESASKVVEINPAGEQESGGGFPMTTVGIGLAVAGVSAVAFLVLKGAAILESLGFASFLKGSFLSLPLFRKSNFSLCCLSNLFRRIPLDMVPPTTKLNKLVSIYSLGYSW